MADEDDGSEKTEEPSQYRLEEFRAKGQVAISRELNSVLSLFAAVLVLLMSSFYVYEVSAEFFEWAYSINSESVLGDLEKFKIIISHSMLSFFKCLIPIFIATMAIGIVSNVVQTGIIFAPEVLTWNFERINPLTGIQRMFSSKILFETLKSLFKIAIVTAVIYVIIRKEMNSFTGLLHVDIYQSVVFGKILFSKISFSIIIGMMVVAIGDFAWERYQYRKKLLMTKHEAKEELKEREGNPEIKQRIRTIQREMSRKRMMAKVPTADAIISNPTHISVAIKYDANTMVAPTVIAKGADFMALKIREIAREYQVPIVENVQLARTLYKTVKVGESVPRNLYKAVAEILAFVYKRKKKTI